VDSPEEGRLTIHGHFYQPPRENPWIEEVELEESAAPYHDWNERIVTECYRPNSCSRIVDGEGRILHIVNNYGLISYNFGPSIMRWLERCYPGLYGRILAGDAAARETLGHGGAIACAYNHAILPLCNGRDLETQIIWGKEEFSYRFGRDPEAMWLPETAANMEVLEALVRHGMIFCILAPTQAAAVRPLGGGGWEDVSGGKIDTTQPYRCYVSPEGAPARRFMDIFFYDGAAAHAVSFEDLLSDARRLVARLGAAYRPERGREQLLHLATDGETFGHHKPLGNMALAYALKVAAPQTGFSVTNYGTFLAGFAPRFEVRLSTGPEGKGTSWSCPHGVARWYRDCGCTTGSRPGWNQAWRTPLREAFDRVRDRLGAFYEQEAGELLADPWEARDGYIQLILDRSPKSRERFFERYGRPGIGPSGRLQALKLLEMQRHCLLMYTSCGWFFADLAGLETVQVIQYCARALELAKELGLDVEEEFLGLLEKARSNLPRMGNGREVYARLVRPTMVGPERVVNHFAIGSIFTEDIEELREVFHYRVHVLDYEKRQRGAVVLAAGLVELTPGIIPEPRRYLFAVTFLGGYFFRTGVQETAAENAQALRKQLFDLLEEQPGNVIALIEEIFGPHLYSLRDVFKDRRKLILQALVSKELEDYDKAFDDVYKTTRDAMEEMVREGLTVPVEFRAAAERSLSRGLAEQVKRIRCRTVAANKIVESEIKAVVEQARPFRLELETSRPSSHLSRVFLQAVAGIVSEPHPDRVAEAACLFDLAAHVDLPLDLTEPQNLLYDFLNANFRRLAEEARAGEPEASRPLAEALLSLAAKMNFNVDRYERMLREGHGEA
jgi:alpha-amylase/alpha-mannosidase (GH57 family)